MELPGSSTSQKVALASCATYDRLLVKQAVEKVAEHFGLSGRIKPGDRVLLKPNLVMGFPAEAAVNTHPEVVRAVGELLHDCGARLSLGDSPGVSTARKACKSCGLDEVAEYLGAEIVEFTPRGKIAGENENSLLAKADLAKEALEADHLINLPKFKTHAFTNLTIGVKNLFGCVAGTRKFQWHYRAGHNVDLFCRMLMEVYLQVHPCITILDAVVGMEGEGPTGGRPKQLGFVAAAENCSALDAVCARIVGAEWESVPTLRAARDNKLERWDAPEVVGTSWESLKPEAFELPKVRPNLYIGPEFLKKHFRRWITSRPVPNGTTCIGCGACARLCPAKAITMAAQASPKAALPVIDHDKCIRCYCCQELCDRHAMDLRKPKVLRFLEMLGRWRSVFSAGGGR